MSEINVTRDPSTPRPIVKYSEDWWVTRSPEVRARRCHGHKKNGDQCGKVAMQAQQVCGTHGGRAPQAKRNARQRIEEAADRMARQLLGIAESAESEAVKLAAVKDALDRAGLKPPAQVEVATKPLEPWEELMRDVAHITRAQHEALKNGVLLPPEPPALPRADDGLKVVDAELVPDPHAVPHSSGPRTTVGSADRSDRSKEAKDESASSLAPPPPRNLAQDEAADVMRESRLRMHATSRNGQKRRMH